MFHLHFSEISQTTKDFFASSLLVTSTLVVDPVDRLNIDYHLVEYYLNRSFHSLVPRRDVWDPDLIIHSELQGIYTDGAKFDNRSGSGVFSDKLDLNISLRL